MKENCLDIGIVQAFMDGELPHDQIAGVSDHLERCDSCAFMLNEAEDEAAFVFSALDREFNSLVPTQRLWSKINESIETEQANRPFWQKAQAFLGAAFANPSMVAAAGLLIVMGAFSLVFWNDQGLPGDIAVVPTDSRGTNAPVPAAEPIAVNRPITVSSEGDTVVSAGPRIERAVYRPKSASKAAVSAGDRVAIPASNSYFGAEESYVKTISSLSRTVEEQKDDVLRPSKRIAYERDMALVNDTIAKMRREVKRNPRNDSAKQVLYSSYQNKIDLLNSVSQKEELVASLK
jgi:hypothetical protein